MVVIIIRNMKAAGLHNGTRVIITRIHSAEHLVFVAKIDAVARVNGDLSALPIEEQIPIPRITFDINIRNAGRLMLRRRQYPFIPAYAMTVHKSQGQTLDRCVIYLADGPFFEHGHAYVAVSRCRTRSDLGFMLSDDNLNWTAANQAEIAAASMPQFLGPAERFWNIVYPELAMIAAGRTIPLPERPPAASVTTGATHPTAAT